MEEGGAYSVFRIEALRRNSRGVDETILPQFSSPKTVWLLWIFIVLSLTAGTLIWLIRIPIYARAIAIPLTNESQSAISGINGNNEPLMAVLIPGRNASQVRVGQRVFWSFTKSGERVSSTVIEVKPMVRSPDSLNRELDLRGQAAASITEPAVIALVSLGPVPYDLPASTYAGSVYRAEVEIGTKRVFSLLPVLRRFIGD
jgi:hypothetical protein